MILKQVVCNGSVALNTEAVLVSSAVLDIKPEFYKVLTGTVV